MAYWRQALSLLCLAKVTLKLRKCSLLAKTINYHGLFIRLERLELSDQTTAAICELIKSTIQTKLRSLLGLWNVVCRLDSDFSKVEATLTKIFTQRLPASLHCLTSTGENYRSCSVQIRMPMKRNSMKKAQIKESRKAHFSWRENVHVNDIFLGRCFVKVSNKRLFK